MILRKMYGFIACLIVLVNCAGCGSGSNINDFPAIFGPSGMLDPMNPSNAGTLDAGSRLQVFAEDGQGGWLTVSGASVKVDGGTNGSTFTDDSGFAFFAPMPTGRHVMDIAHPDYYIKKILVAVTPNENDNQFEVSLSEIPKDDYEVHDGKNDNDSMNNAYDFELHYTFSWAWRDDLHTNSIWLPCFSIEGTIHSAQDVDYYKFNVGSGVCVKLLVPDNCDYDLAILDASGNVSISRITTGNGLAEEVLSYTAGTAAFPGINNNEYYIKIYPKNGTAFSSTEPYTLIMDKH